MRTLAKKMVSIFLSVVLVLGIFSTILPAMSLTTMAQNATTEYDYTIVLNGVSDDTSINDTRAVDVWDSDIGGVNDFSTVGLERLGIWNAMGLDAAWGALGISKNFFNGTAVGAEADEIHPYIVYNVTPGTSFELSSAVHKESNADEFALTFYASNDGATWVPINAERSLEGIWKSMRETWDSYNSYVYTIGNVGLRTNFIKVEYPITMTSRLADGALPEDKLLVYGAAFTPVENYAVNGQTLFEAESFARQKELYEKYFIAFPDFVNMDSSESSFNRAATTNSGMISGATWGSFEEKDRSYVAMVAPGSHFYLETTNNWYMKSVGEALVANGELESADQARIRVYSSASLSDDAAWTEWNPMPYACGGPHTPTFNFYLPENHIYVRIVYPQKGSIATITTKDGAQVVDASGNDAAFFNDMVFTPYVAAEAEYSRDYTGSDSVYEEVVAVNGGMGQSEYGVTLPWTNGKNLANDAAQNTEDPYADGYFSVVYNVTGGKMFNLEYAVRLGNFGGTAGDGNTKGNYEANVTDGSQMEIIIESSDDGINWSNAYETESGYAQTTNSYNGCYAYDVSYLVPYSAKYVRVSMGITGVGYLADNSTYQGFNDCIYIRKVSVADGNNIYGVTKDNSDKEFVYATDTDATGTVETSNTETASIDDATGFRGEYGYLVAGDGANVKTLAGTLARPYVVYDVLPGSEFSFDYAMRATAKAASEATAAFNIKAGLGSEALKEFELFVYGRRNKTSEWMYLGKTDSSALDYKGGDTSSYDTMGYGENSITVPAGVNQIKVELPNTGAFTTATPVSYDYTTMSGDFGGWNYNNLGAFDTYNGGNADCKLVGNSGSGLGVHYGDAQGDWGTKSFYLIYAVQPNSTFVATFKMPDEATRNGYAEKTGEPFEFVVSAAAEWNGTYSNEATTAGQGTDATIGYRVPAGCNYVKVTFPTKGIIPDYNYVANDNTFFTGVSFYNNGAWVTAGNDAAYLYNVTYATGVAEDVEEPETNVEYVYEYSTDTDASGANSTSNTETGSIDNATGFRGEYGYLVAGDGANVKTLAGTLARPYVIYDVFPGSEFSFDYAMRATAKAASEATAAFNINAGFGSEGLKEYEFFVYGRADESSEWTYIGKTDSSALDYKGGDTSSYDTMGYGKNSFTVPAGVNQIKVELPNTGAFTTATPVTYDYTTMSGDFGGWNYNNLGAFDTYNGGNANCKLVGNSGSGLGVHYGDAQGDWGTKSFYLIYAVQPNSTFVATFKMPDEGTRNGYAEKTGEPFEFVVSACATWDGTYSNEVTTAGQGTDATIGYRVPAGCNYVKVTFPTKGIIPDLNYVANDNTFMTGVSFYNNGAWVTAGNDAAYLYNVTYATSATEKTEEVFDESLEYTYDYVTDADASGANSTSNTATGAIDNATGFNGDYVYLVDGDGNNVKTLAGTLARPYVIYDVFPGSEFSFDYAMRATAKAASEATAAFNINAGFGSEALKEYEFFVYGRKDESSEWTYIGKTDSSALDYKGGDTSSYDTIGYGKNSITVPSGVFQIKVELPNTGAFTTATPATYDYTTGFSGDYAGWNGTSLGAFDNTNGVNNSQYITATSGSGLSINWSHAQVTWGSANFYIIYKVQPNSTFVATFNMPDEATRNGYAEKTGEPFEFVVESSSSYSDGWANAATTAGQGTNATIGYRVPAGCEYVKVTFPQKGIIPDLNYVANDNTYMTGASFYNSGAWVTAGNDAAYLYNVTYAASAKVKVEYEYTYATDADASGANSTSNTETGSIDNATGFRGEYGYLVAGDGANVKTLAGTLERPYVIYDVFPGSEFSFDYAMRATAKAASEATAAFNINAGFGSEALKEYEFFVYGRKDESSEWTFIGKTDSSALDYNGGDTSSYDTFGYGKNSITVPDNVNQIKVELPGTGAFTTATPVTYDYTTMSGDFGGWNYNNLGAYDTYYGGNADCKIFGNSGSGLGVHYGDAQGDWGTKSFYLIYAVQPNSTFVATFKMPDEGTRNGYAEKTGEPFEFVVSACATADGTYGDAVTTAGQGTNATIGYRVPAGCNYVKVTFPTKGIIPDLNYVANDNTFFTGVSFYNNGAWVTAGNDAAYLYNVTYATSAKEKSNVEYNYITDTDATETNSTSNTETGSIDNATGFRGEYGYLVAGDGNNVKTLAGTLERPYVIYDVVPGSEFSFDYAMRATAKAASEATAAFNINAGFGSEALKEYEFFVYGRKNESSDWKLIGKTDSSALDYKGGDTSSYDTFGYGANSIVVPENTNQIKVELPGTGAFTTATPVTYDYTTFSGDFGGWNYNNLGAFDTYNGGNADCKIFGNSGLGLGVHYSDAQGDWGTKSFYLIYAVQPNSTFVANFKMPDEATRNGYAEKTGEPFEFVVSAAAEWNGTYTGEATTAGQGTDATIGYRVPAGCNYVKVTFPTKGIIPDYNYVANDNTFFTGVSFYNNGAWVTAGNDAAYLYNVTFASSVKEDVEYTYTTDSEANKTNSTSNTATGAIDNATGFQGDYVYLVDGDGANVKTLAGTLARPYVIYDVEPGSAFSFDYAMRATAKAASEATAAFNINAGFGSEALKEYEFFVYGRKDESSDWKLIGKTDSSALDYKGGDTSSYDTFGYGANSITVPAGVNQIKVELPNTGAFTTATPVSYDYTTMSGDFGGWNANSSLGAFDDYNGINANCKLVGNSGSGLGVHYSDAQGDWGTKSFYLIYAVQPNSTFVATFKMPDEGTRNGYAEKTGEPFEFVVSAAAEWNGTYSNEATTAGQGTNATIGYRVPAGCNYVKVTFPTKGIIPDLNYVANDSTFMTGVSFYAPGAWVTAGNDAAYLYNVTFASSVVGGTEEDDTTGDDTTGDDTTGGDDTVVDTNVVDYTTMDSANISSSNKEALKLYNYSAVSVVNGNGVQANGDDAFVTYKIKEDTMLIINTLDALSFEYSVDDITYKAFDAVKTCAGYVIPAITGRNYIKVKLDNGEAIANTDAVVLGPTARFYIPYLDKYELVDYADYGVAANSVSSTLNTLRPGYVFKEWSNYNSEEVYADTLFEAVYTKDTAGDHTYTIEWTTDNGATTNTKELNFDDSISFTAPDTDADGKVFAKWVDANGVTVSNKKSFTLLVSGDLSLRAVYASAKADIDAHIYVTEKAIIKTSDSDSTRWNMSVVWSTELSEDVTIVETGIILGKDATKAELILVDGELQSGTTKLKHTNTDDNKTSMYTVKNIKAGATRTALPYAILSNGDEIYGDKVITVVGGTQREVSEDYLIDESISVDVLNNYLDRTVTYDAFGTINSQTHAEAVADTRDFVRKTGAKYLARTTGAWVPTDSDIYGQNFSNYANWIADIHEVDPDVVLEAAIFETVTTATDSLVIPDWVQAEFGETVQTGRTFSAANMMHDATYFDWSSFSNKTYGENQWGTGIHVPSISKVETQMYIYYRACTYIDMGIEAIHLGQMYRIGAEEVSSAENVNSVDLENWELVLDKITEYAKTNARRGYVMFNGHTEDFVFENADGSQMLDFTMSPVRIQADGSSGTTQTAQAGFQSVRLSKSTDGENVPYIDVVTNVTTRSGEECAYFPYLLEFDNYGYDADNIDTIKTTSQYDYVWGYDEISWYANQDADLRAAYLSTLNDSIKGLTDAPNGHIAMPGRRTAFISNTGCSEYKDLDWVQALMNSNGIAEVSIWEVSETDIAGIIAAWN